MTKIKDFIKTHKAQMITILTGVISFLVAVNDNITTTAKVGMIITLATVVCSALVSVLQKGFSNETIDLLVRAIQIIQNMIIESKNPKVVGAKRLMTKEEIREELIKD